jgi:hypothetical protein
MSHITKADVQSSRITEELADDSTMEAIQNNETLNEHGELLQEAYSHRHRREPTTLCMQAFIIVWFGVSVTTVFMIVRGIL